ncbi:DNA-formamidopyrimidine glycosylase family protein [Aeromicrobium sp.]|uniref:Fpg/Nei family DNA glycosylase n=1 Tax=Aeromicrobium sp. TaxID=1871063 RepID=UPI00198BFCE5|nr:DNA-formamidopyrimidine glycosylase family protein [Aeromicrobium sp.]MBC7631647.1 Fpg/Nei family DNA glycosylase [Aeromicrobium sp.]
MPEGHTLHRLASRLNRTMSGNVVTSTSPQGRFTAGAGLVDGLPFGRSEAWGKHLLVRVADSAEMVHVHLGLYGKFTFVGGHDHPVVGQVRWRLQHEGWTADLRGPTACELLDPVGVDALKARLGPDPLRKDADPDRAWQRMCRSRAPMATLLMDQRVLAGVGNVYRAELLFRHHVDPDLPGRELDETTWLSMWDDLAVLMRHGVRTGRMDTVRPEDAQGPAARGRRRGGGEVYVYRRADLPCLVCGTTVLARVLGGRNLFWCPSCQPSR